jgi:hypothetical protein
MLLLNGQEFPIAMENLQPIVARASNKVLTITTDITGIWIVNGALQFGLAPRISSVPVSKKKISAPMRKTLPVN